jgi:hypothetical protein
MLTELVKMANWGVYQGDDCYGIDFRDWTAWKVGDESFFFLLQSYSFRHPW